jgi:hypothetical protein
MRRSAIFEGLTIFYPQNHHYEKEDIPKASPQQDQDL